MRQFRAFVVTVVIAFSLQAQQPQVSQSPWWTRVEALANDGMEGRNTGSAGHKRAAEYVAAEFRKAGLEPAGLGGYIQPVAFKTRRIVENQSSLTLERDGRTEPLVLGTDANISMRVDTAP